MLGRHRSDSGISSVFGERVTNKVKWKCREHIQLTAVLFCLKDQLLRLSFSGGGAQAQLLHFKQTSEKSHLIIFTFSLQEEDKDIYFTPQRQDAI